MCPLCKCACCRQMFVDLAIWVCDSCWHAFRSGAGTERILYTTGIKMPGYLESTQRNRIQYRFLEKYIGFSRINSLLEIGCGNGSFLRYVRSRHSRINLAAIEPGENFMPFLRRISGLIIVDDFIDAVQLPGKYDLVVLSHVLEHIERPFLILKNVIRKYLSDNGHICIDIPNGEYELRNSSAARVTPQTHLFFFNGTSLKDSLSKMGLHTIFSCKYSTLPYLYLWLSERIGNERTGDGKLNKIKLKALKALRKISLEIDLLFKWALYLQPRTSPVSTSNVTRNNMIFISSLNISP
jgi:hypothetical protein